MATARFETPILFIHGYWHGAWCWADVLARVTAAGARALAVDMAGHGLNARRPEALNRRPFDQGLLATEASPVGGVDLDQAGDLLVSQIRQLGGGAPVVVVAHSMGGAVLTRAAQLAPDLIAHAVYLTAFMPAADIPAQAYAQMLENEGQLVLLSVVADPAAVGALRLDTASTDPDYRKQLRAAFYGDVDPDVADAVIALLSPDAPVGIGLGTTTLTADGWGRVPRTYVTCARDMAIRPTLQAKFIAEADAAFPGNPTTVHALVASHSPFLSMPDKLTEFGVLGPAIGEASKRAPPSGSPATSTSTASPAVTRRRACVSARSGSPPRPAPPGTLTPSGRPSMSLKGKGSSSPAAATSRRSAPATSSTLPPTSDTGTAPHPTTSWPTCPSPKPSPATSDPRLNEANTSPTTSTTSADASSPSRGARA